VLLGRRLQRPQFLLGSVEEKGQSIVESISIRGRLTAGMLTFTACATAPVTNPPPTVAAVQKESPVAKVAPPRAKPVAKDQVAFGFSKGMTLAQANALVALRLVPRNSATFAARKMPVPHPPFSEVLVQISLKVGLCRVRASTPATEAGRAGPQFEAVLHELVVRHGTPEADVGKDPAARAVWEEPFGPGSAIWVYESKNSRGASTVVVDYLFTNYEVCRDE
jgi:hypothetical protein